MASKSEFDAWDWILFALTLVISVGIGIFYAIRDKSRESTNEFLMGGRRMQIIPVSISILVSFMSAILILGTPADMYIEGTEYYLYLVGMIIAVILAAQLYVPLMYPLQLTSSFEYLEKRFDSKAAKLTGTIMTIVQQGIYMGIASYAPSTALEAVTGFPTWVTLITVGCVSTFYTFLGGMKAVVWTDVFQSFVMVAGVMAIVIQGAISVGGMENVWQINEDWDRIEFFDFNPDPTEHYSFWSLIFGGIVGWTATYGVNQASVQRYSAVPTLKKAKITVLLNIIGVFILMTLTCMSGIVVFAYYADKGCDPLSNGELDNSNQLIPYFVMEKLGYPGLPGLFVACLFSGALSTMSSCLNALSAVTWEDILKPYMKEKTDSQKTWITRILVAMYGGVGVGMSFIAMNLEGTVLQVSLSFIGATSGPVLGIFTLGAFFPWANWIGAVVGSVFGLVFPMWMSIGAYNVVGSVSKKEFPTYNCSTLNETTTVTMVTQMTTSAADEISGVDQLYRVSNLWYPTIGAVIVIVVGMIVSFITGANKMGDVDPRYIIPIFDRLFCCLPNAILRKLRCNQEFPDPYDFVPYKEFEIEPDEKTPIMTFSRKSGQNGGESKSAVSNLVSYKVNGNKQNGQVDIIRTNDNKISEKLNNDQSNEESQI